MNETNETSEISLSLELPADTPVMIIGWPQIVRGVMSVLWTVGIIWFAMISHNVMAAWVRGGSLDLRCIYGVRGYVETRHYERQGEHSATCNYNPDIEVAVPPAARGY